MVSLGSEKGIATLANAMLIMILVAIATLVFYNYLDQFVSLTRTQLKSTQNYYYKDFAMQYGKWIMDKHIHSYLEDVSGLEDANFADFEIDLDGDEVNDVGFYIQIEPPETPSAEYEMTIKGTFWTDIHPTKGVHEKPMVAHYANGDITYLSYGDFGKEVVFP